MTLKTIGKKEVTLVHVAKSQLGLSEDEYRGMLSSVGVSSSKELDYRGFDELMNKLRACGFKPLGGSKRAAGMHSDLLNKSNPCSPRSGLFWRIWTCRGPMPTKWQRKCSA